MNEVASEWENTRMGGTRNGMIQEGSGRARGDRMVHEDGVPQRLLEATWLSTLARVGGFPGQDLVEPPLDS